MLAVLFHQDLSSANRLVFTETKVKIACEQQKAAVVQIVVYLHNRAVFKGLAGLLWDNLLHTFP